MPCLRHASANARADAPAASSRSPRPLPRVAEIGIPGVAVEHHGRRPEEQRRDERVPHHPGGRREPQGGGRPADVPGQAELLQVLEQDPAVAVDDPLRQARRARGEEDVERMRERHRVELDGPGSREQLSQGTAPGTWRRRNTRRRRPSRELGRALTESGHVLGPVDDLLAVAVTADGEQHLGLDLPESVDDAAGAELGRARRPDRAEARRRQERGDRLRDVREVRDDAVARTDAEPLQAGAHPCPPARGARRT